MRDEIIKKYSTFLRCLGCNTYSVSAKSFFLHLDSHKKNLKGIKRKYDSKDDQYLGELQLAIISSKPTVDELFENEDLPDFVLGSQVTNK